MTYPPPSPLQHAHRIAVVIPVYKVERYLLQCLDSLEAQTYRNFVAFAVDDGSPDNCGRMLDKYAETHPWLRVFHKENGGVSSARNLALDQIEEDGSFEFLSFVDPDDWVSTTFLQDFVEAAVKHNADCVICGFENYIPSGPLDCWDHEYPASELDQNGIINQFFGLNEWQISNPTAARFLSNRFFRIGKIRSLRFDPNLFTGEDQNFFIRSIQFLRKGYCFPSRNYAYRLRSSSITRQFNTSIYDVFLFLQMLRDHAYPKSALIGIERSLLDSWWSATRIAYKTGDNDVKNKCREVYNQLQTITWTAPPPRKYNKRFFFFFLGDTFLKFYFFIRKNRTSLRNKYFP